MPPGPRRTRDPLMSRPALPPRGHASGRRTPCSVSLRPDPLASGTRLGYRLSARAKRTQASRMTQKARSAPAGARLPRGRMGASSQRRCSEAMSGECCTKGGSQDPPLGPKPAAGQADAGVCHVCIRLPALSSCAARSTPGASRRPAARLRPTSAAQLPGRRSRGSPAGCRPAGA